ncbi:MAG: PQQ-dependent sugar dehydrogenase [Flavobacteriales bacterium]|nr:PQQ-dependent sugar dehydrogenase [Flavobacteriales bacterium]MCB9190080.1 PQQ-dependent sugar dehydrogenase [Flavobacteriales bacterium]MCB9205057.1 PQQ-dependent sugar dehydrogenase [Flavobacteriales bacterium]
MKRLFTFSIIILAAAVSGMAQPSTVTVGNTTLDVRVVIQGTNSTNGIDIPWEIQWGPDDYIWMTERYGRVSRLNPETGARTTILDLTSTVYDNSESGLLGLALHPDFTNTPQVFLAYTYYSGGIKERIVRYDYSSASNTLINPLTLIEGINGNTTHIGCRLLILPDNTLLATTGDYQNQSSPQNESSLSGKILRMNLDGTIPADNPFGSSSYLYSKGHRNAQGMVLAPNGNLYSSEHGPSTNDELNIIVPGGNYGWPDVAGLCNTGSEMAACNLMTNYQDPIAIWYENSTIATSDLIWYDHPAIPEWQGKLLMAVLKAEHIKEIEVDNTDGTTVESQTIWFNNSHSNNPSSSFSSGTFDRLRDICASPDGRVFLATSGPSWGTSGTFQNSIIELKNAAYSAVSVNEVQEVKTSVYPNPTNGQINMVFAPELVGAGYTLVNNLGQVVAEGTVSSTKVASDFSGLAPGLYILRSTNVNYTTNQQVLISK